MTRIKEPIALSVTAHYDAYTVSWEDNETRYHVWLGRNGQLESGDAHIYKNKKTAAGTFGHKTTKAKLSNHPTVRNAILALGRDRFDEADRRAVKLDEEKTAAAHIAKIESLRQEAANLGFELVPVSA